MSNDYIYFLCADGACSGNPGPGGYAWELWENHIADGCEAGDGAGSSVDTTNNIMELRAAIDGLSFVRDGIISGDIVTPSTVKLRFDSEYVLKGIFEWMAGWKAKGWTKKGGLKNADLWKELDAIVEDIKWRTVTLEADWVKGHAGDMGNERVDTKAVQMRDLAAQDLAGTAPEEDAVRMKAPAQPVIDNTFTASTGYFIVSDLSKDKLIAKVNDFISRGFTPIGGVSIETLGNNTVFHQAVHR